MLRLPNNAPIRAKELFTKLDSQIQSSSKTRFEFGTSEAPDLSGVNGIVLYEFVDPRGSGESQRHLGILRDGKEMTLTDPVSLGYRGSARVILCDARSRELANL